MDEGENEKMKNRIIGWMLKLVKVFDLSELVW